MSEEVESIDGLVLGATNAFKDHRGWFRKLYPVSSASKADGRTDGDCLRQVNVSVTKEPGTVRGLHLQTEPFTENKIVTCLSGSVFDVVVDLRMNSPTFGKYVALELNSEVEQSLCVPKGCAHGFQVLSGPAMLLYMHDEVYTPSVERGVHPLDEDLNIQWPLEVKNLSQRDSALPSFSEFERKSL